MGAIHIGTSYGDVFAGHSTLEVTVCTCGVIFGVPQKLLDTRREDGASFYCPNGHNLSFDGIIHRLKRERDNARDRAARAEAMRDQTEASLRATKGVVTKQRKKLDRVKHGVCPCCNRHFENVEAHMATEHPDFDPVASEAAPR